MEFKLKTKEVFFGLIIGITANCVGVLLTVIILFSEYRLTNIIELINSSIDNNYITKLISLGAVINLIVFFLLLKYDNTEKARGVLIATFLMAILTIYLNNF